MPALVAECAARGEGGGPDVSGHSHLFAKCDERGGGGGIGRVHDESDHSHLLLKNSGEKSIKCIVEKKYVWEGKGCMFTS